MEKVKTIFWSFLKYLRYNKLFSSYVILSLLCCLTLRLYTVGNFFDLKPLFFEFGIILFIGAFGYLSKPQKQFRYYLIWLIIYMIMGVVNTIYYKFYNSFASFSLLTALGQVGEVGDAVFAKMNLFQFIYILAPIIFYFINYQLNNRDYFNYVSKFENGKLLFKRVILFSIIILVISFASLNKTALSRLVKQWDREYIVARYGMIIYQANDLISTLKPTVISLKGYDIAVKEVNNYYDLNTIPKSKNEYTNMFKDYNIIFVHMESMTNFLIDLKINDTIITPNLNNLSKEGIFFTNFYAQTGVGTSSDTEFTISSSLMPATSGTVFVSYYDKEYITIQKLLKEKDYYTFSMHGNKGSMWNRDKVHPKLGYTDFYSKNSYEIDEIIGLGLSDKSFFKQIIPMLQSIEDNNKKYMGTIITLSNHTPFTNNEYFEQIDLNAYNEKYNDENIYEIMKYSYLENTKLGDYIRSSHYADQALGQFLTSIKESAYFNNTLFVFYGDHDPKLSIKDFYYYFNFNFENGELFNEEEDNYINYNYFENELNKKVPLILWTKNKKIIKEEDYYMGMIDVMPTIGNMVDIYNPYALGHDIFDIKNNNIISFPNGNFLTNKIYYNNTKGEYKAISLDEILSDDYIKQCNDYTSTQINISNNIIIYNLIKNKLESASEK